MEEKRWGPQERDKEAPGNHFHVGSQPSILKRLPVLSLLSGSGWWASPGDFELRAWGCCKRRRVSTCVCVCVRGGWQPPWGGHLGWLSAAIYISKPRRRILPPHSSCLFWGVTFWQSEKLFAAASKPPVTCISASPGPCVTGMPSPPCHSQAPPPSLCPLSICWVGPWLFPEAVFKVWRWCLYLGPCTLFLEPERPVYFP